MARELPHRAHHPAGAACSEVAAFRYDRQAAFSARAPFAHTRHVPTVIGALAVQLSSPPLLLLALLALPAAFLVGLAFSAVGLIMTVLARGWDFFSFYMTLVMTPMMMISGVFFPAERLPGWLLAVGQALPLYHGVELVRPLLAGRAPTGIVLHLAVLLGYAAAGYLVAIRFARRRFAE